MLMVQKQETIYKLHKKLGHLSAKNMRRLENLSEEMEFTAEEIEETVQDCKICLKTKQARILSNSTKVF